MSASRDAPLEPNDLREPTESEAADISSSTQLPPFTVTNSHDTPFSSAIDTIQRTLPSRPSPVTAVHLSTTMTEKKEQEVQSADSSAYATRIPIQNLLPQSTLYTSQPQQPSPSQLSHSFAGQSSPYGPSQGQGYLGMGMGQAYTMQSPISPQYGFPHSFVSPHDPNVMSGMVTHPQYAQSPLSPHHGGMVWPRSSPESMPGSSSQSSFALSSGGPSPSGTPNPPQLPYTPHANAYSPVQYAPVTSPQYQYTAPSPLQFQQGGSQGLYPSQFTATQHPSYASPDASGTWWYSPSPAAPSASEMQQQVARFPNRWYPTVIQGPSPTLPPGSTSNFALPTPVITGPPESPVISRSVAPASPLTHNSLRLSRGQRPNDASSVGSDSAAARRPYHPNPPAHRSDWVMWVGNVPSDATHDELWRFFNQPTQPPAQPPHLPSNLLTIDDDIWGGVSSVFLISRSNCAFVNYDTESHLESAVAHFNGRPLRVTDPRCPRLVCRVRRKDDDLRAGVGGQRGMGMHTRHVREMKERERLQVPAPISTDVHGSRTGEVPSSPATNDSYPSTGSSAAVASGEDQPKGGSVPHYSGSSGSTSSSFLTKHFPQRYFILKSLSEFDLNLSVENGLWATQMHNEGVLDQAYRTSQDIYLIFGVNKSGEFFGYARMEGPISKGERRVSWASRTDSSPAHSFMGSPTRARTFSNPPQPPIKEADEEISPPLPPSNESPAEAASRTSSGMILSPSHVADSPAPVSPWAQANLDAALETGIASTHSSSTHARPVAPPYAGPLASAPAELHERHRQLTAANVPPTAGTLNVHDLRAALPVAKTLHAASITSASDFKLDEDAPARAIREQSLRGSSSREQTRDKDGILRKDTYVEPDRQDGAAQTDQGNAAKGEGQWGTAFKIRWIRTDRMPFHRTRHLRNPWNHDREVKVSRDGTELEPSIGQKLLEEWESPEPPPPPPSAFPRRVGPRPPYKQALSTPAQPPSGTRSLGTSGYTQLPYPGR